MKIPDRSARIAARTLRSARAHSPEPRTAGEFHAIRAALNQRAYHVRVVCNDPRKLAAAAVGLPSVDAVHVDPDVALLILSRNVLDVQIELPRLAQAGDISLRRVEPLDDSLESVFGYLVEG